jgi:hypothetical protein
MLSRRWSYGYGDSTTCVRYVNVCVLTESCSQMVNARVAEERSKVQNDTQWPLQQSCASCRVQFTLVHHSPSSLRDGNVRARTHGHKITFVKYSHAFLVCQYTDISPWQWVYMGYCRSLCVHTGDILGPTVELRVDCV